MKNLEKVKTIINQQKMRDLTLKILKISQLIYIRNLLKEKNFTDCNTPIILIKAVSAIEIN